MMHRHCLPATAQRRSHGGVPLSMMALIVGGVMMVGCASPLAPSTEGATADAGPSADTELLSERKDPLGQAAYWGNVLQRDPRNEEAAVNLSRALFSLGKFKRAADVAEQALTFHPRSAELLQMQGRSMIAIGRGSEAVGPLHQANKLDSKNWRTATALGVAYDQVGESGRALEAHARALGLSPNNPDILSNIGYSYALAGDIDNAVQYMRQAAETPDATMKTRQNLAYMLCLAGRFDEAETIARQDLPAQAARDLVDKFRAQAAIKRRQQKVRLP